MEAIIRPSIFCPFPAALNPSLKAVRPHLSNWVEHYGLVRSQTARLRFHAADFAHFAACTHPTIPAQQLALICDWFAWLFLVDDQLDDGRFGTQVDRSHESMTELLALLAPERSSYPQDLTQSSAAHASLADLWERTYPLSTVPWRARFVRHMVDCFAAAAWEVQNRVNGWMPDLATYQTKRRDTGAIYVCLDLIEVVQQIHLPEPIYQSSIVQTLVEAASNVICWCNDLFSLEKELALGEYHNLVLVLQRVSDLSLQEAVNEVSKLISREVLRFIDAERQVMAYYPEWTQELQKELAGMKSWMRGNLDWSQETERYRNLDAAAYPQYLETIMEREQQFTDDPLL